MNFAIVRAAGRVDNLKATEYFEALIEVDEMVGQYCSLENRPEKLLVDGTCRVEKDLVPVAKKYISSLKEATTLVTLVVREQHTPQWLREVKK